MGGDPNGSPLVFLTSLIFFLYEGTEQGLTESRKSNNPLNEVIICYFGRFERYFSSKMKSLLSIDKRRNLL